MREAFHVIDKVPVKIPLAMEKPEVERYRRLSKKDIFECPYCMAKVTIKAGTIRRAYFAHKHSEACEESQQVEASLGRYEGQTKRESPRHNIVVSLMLDELKIAEKLNDDVVVIEGYKNLQLRKFFPDILLKVGSEKLAISIITNVNEGQDSGLAMEIAKRKQYFIENNLKPIWFIERSNMALETDINGIVLWESELETLIRTKEDFLWEAKLNDLTNIEEFSKIINYRFQVAAPTFEVSSIYYLSPAKEKNTIQVLRIIQDRVVKPIRAYYLFEPYTLSFSQALSIQELSIQLSNPETEENKRLDYEKRLAAHRFQFEEEMRVAEENRIREEKEKEEKEARMAKAVERSNAERLKLQNDRVNKQREKPVEHSLGKEVKTMPNDNKVERLMRAFRGG